MMSDITEVIPQTNELTKDELRSKILELEASMKALPDEMKIEIKTTHHFAPGVYMREVLIPKGATVTGHIHKTEHMNVLSQGELIVWTEDGMKRLKASQVIKSSPGTKRAAVALEDSVWITVHPNPENISDPNELEELLIVETFEELENYVKSMEEIECRS